MIAEARGCSAELSCYTKLFLEHLVSSVTCTFSLNSTKTTGSREATTGKALQRKRHFISAVLMNKLTTTIQLTNHN